MRPLCILYVYTSAVQYNVFYICIKCFDKNTMMDNGRSFYIHYIYSYMVIVVAAENNTIIDSYTTIDIVCIWPQKVFDISRLLLFLV